MNYQAIIDQYYPEDDDLRRLLLKHSRQVADRCLLICDHHPELMLDREFLEESAMLHDIGIRWCNAQIGAELLRSLGWERYARVAERHTGTGLTASQIVSQHLPLPPQDFVPEAIEEQVVCYADKFYSKSHPDRVLTVVEAAQSLEKFGHEGVERFLVWAKMFE